jgi:hypothetical protein
VTAPGSIHIPVCGIVHRCGAKAALRELCHYRMLQRIVCNEKGLPLGEALSALVTALSHFSLLVAVIHATD